LQLYRLFDIQKEFSCKKGLLFARRGEKQYYPERERGEGLWLFIVFCVATQQTREKVNKHAFSWIGSTDIRILSRNKHMH
jgi:hypothetical protein